MAFSWVFYDQCILLRNYLINHQSFILTHCWSEKYTSFVTWMLLTRDVSVFTYITSLATGVTFFKNSLVSDVLSIRPWQQAQDFTISVSFQAILTAILFCNTEHQKICFRDIELKSCPIELLEVILKRNWTTVTYEIVYLKNYLKNLVVIACKFRLYSAVFYESRNIIYIIHYCFHQLYHSAWQLLAQSFSLMRPWGNS